MRDHPQREMSRGHPTGKAKGAKPTKVARVARGQGDSRTKDRDEPLYPLDISGKGHGVYDALSFGKKISWESPGQRSPYLPRSR